VHPSTNVAEKDVHRFDAFERYDFEHRLAVARDNERLPGAFDFTIRRVVTRTTA
jgi:hypothetical protein